VFRDTELYRSERATVRYAPQGSHISNGMPIVAERSAHPARPPEKPTVQVVLAHAAPVAVAGARHRAILCVGDTNRD